MSASERPEEAPLASESPAILPESSSATGLDQATDPAERFLSSEEPNARFEDSGNRTARTPRSPAAVLIDVDNLLYQPPSDLGITGIDLLSAVVRELSRRFENSSVFELFTGRMDFEELQNVARTQRVDVRTVPANGTNGVEEAIVRRADELAQNIESLVIVSSDNYFAEALARAEQAGVDTIVVVGNSAMASGLGTSAGFVITVSDLLAKEWITGRWDSVSPPPEADTDESASGVAPEREHVAWLDDEPVDVHADELGRYGVAAALEEQLRTLVAEHPGRSFLIHIDGPWGAGKSTLMRFVQERVAGRKNKPGAWLVIPYDAWRQSKAGPPWLTLLEAIRAAVRSDRDALRGRIWFWCRERARLVERWQRVALLLFVVALTVGAVLVFGFSSLTLTKWGDVAKLVGGLLPVAAAGWLLAASIGRFATLNSQRAAKSFLDSRADPMEDLARHFSWLLAQAGRPAMLLVDDLDRCPESHVVDTLETVQKLLRDHTTKGAMAVPNLIILVAADGRWIRGSYDDVYANLATAVSEPGASIGSLFIQKLFQLTVPVPRLSEALRIQYIADLLSENRDARRRALPEGRAALARRIDEASSGEEILDVLASVSQVERIGVADQAIQRLVVEKDEQVRTRHVLEPFAALVDPTPRSLKRFAMAYSMLRAVRTAEGSVVGVRPLALWTVLITRWPALGDYLLQFPDAVKLFKIGDRQRLKDVPAALVSLFTDPPDELRAVMNHPDGPLDAKNIRECSGQ